MLHLVFDVTSYTSAYGYNTYNTLLYYSPPHPYVIAKSEKRLTNPPILADLIRNYVHSLVNTLSKGRIHYMDLSFDELYGTVIKVTTDLSARESLELWLKLVEELPYEKYKIVLAVEWIGENDVSQDELIDYLTKIMIKSGLKPVALPGFNAVHAIREEREE